MLVRQSTARTIIVGPILDSDGAAKTDEVVGSIKIHKNGGAAGALDGSATLTHSQTGYYLLALTANDLDTLGCAEITLNSGTNSMPPRAVNVITADAWDALHHATDGSLRADAVAISGDATAADNLEAAADGTGYNLGSGQIVAASVTAKTGYSLTSDYDAAKTAAPASTALSTVQWTNTRAGKLDNLDAPITSRHASGAAVAKSPATLAAADVTGNLPADVLNWRGSQPLELAIGKVQADAAVSLEQEDIDAIVDGVVTEIGSAIASPADIYTYFVAENRADAFKATGFSTLTAQQVWEYVTRTISAFGFEVTVAAASVSAIRNGLAITGEAATAADALVVHGDAHWATADLSAVLNAIGVVDGIVDRIAVAAIGDVSGAGSGTEVFVYGGVTLTATVDQDGNRTVVFS